MVLHLQLHCKPSDVVTGAMGVRFILARTVTTPY